MEPTLDDKRIAAALMRLDALMEIRELALPDIYISRWMYLGGEDKGLAHSYEILVEDLSFDEMREDQKEHFGFSDCQADSLKALAVAIKDLIKRVGYTMDNRIYVSSIEWSTIVLLARAAFINLQRCR